MIPFFKPKRASAVLGIALDGSRLEAVSLRRNGALHIKHSVSVALALSPLNDDPALVGQEIRNHLDKAGIRERRCAVCLPLSWVLSLQVPLPEMSEEDRVSFLQLEAERGFHAGSDSHYTTHSIFTTPDGAKHATLLAVPRAQLETLQRVLKAAKLKPVTFALGVTALQPPEADPGRVVLLAVRNNTVDLQVTAGGGIVALRSLDGALDAQGAQKTIPADLIAREIRITLGQLPGGLAAAAGKIRVIGQGDVVRQFVADITPRTNVLGLKMEVAEKASAANFDKPLPSEIAASAALALAANYVRGGASKPEFLPPKVQPWKQLVSTRLSPRKLAYAGGFAGFILLCVAGAFGYQQYQISTLQAKWKSMEPEYNELTTDQDGIKKYRAWYDTTFRDLEILSKLKDAFPTDGSVSAKKVEIHDVSGVTCTGSARDNDSFSRFHDKLGNDTNDIRGLHAEVHGQKPMDFTLNFQWGTGGGNANGN